MNRHGHFGPAVWPYLVAVACLLLVVVGCQDGSGPNLVTSPEGKPDYDAVKPPPPPPPPPPADPAIAFSISGRVRDGRTWRTAWFLKVMNADGTNLTSIFMTQTGQRIWNRPAWSPDGHCIAFEIGGLANVNPGIYLIDVGVVNGVPTGTNLRLLLGGIYEGQPAWAPTGDRIAYTTGYYGESLCVVPVSGGPSEVLYSASLQGASIWSPSWSPDATKIGFAEDGMGLRVLDLTDMTATTVGQGSNPSWARTQDALAFEGPEGTVYTVQLPSGTPTLACVGGMPDWSPTDQALVFRDDYALKKIELATGIITQLMSGSGEDHPWNPAWRRF